MFTINRNHQYAMLNGLNQVKVWSSREAAQAVIDARPDADELSIVEVHLAG